MSKSHRIAALVFGGLFVLLGLTKALGVSPWPELWVRWGYEQGFLLFVGLCEAGGGLLLMIPRLTTVGAVALTPIMLGAIYTHLFRGVPPLALVPSTMAVILVGLGRGGWARFMPELSREQGRT